MVTQDVGQGWLSLRGVAVTAELATPAKTTKTITLSSIWHDKRREGKLHSRTNETTKQRNPKQSCSTKTFWAPNPNPPILPPPTQHVHSFLGRGCGARTRPFSATQSFVYWLFPPQDLRWVRAASGPFSENYFHTLNMGFVNVLKWVQRWVKSGLDPFKTLSYLLPTLGRILRYWQKPIFNQLQRGGNCYLKRPWRNPDAGSHEKKRICAEELVPEIQGESNSNGLWKTWVPLEAFEVWTSEATLCRSGGGRLTLKREMVPSASQKFPDVFGPFQTRSRVARAWGTAKRNLPKNSELIFCSTSPEKQRQTEKGWNRHQDLESGPASLLGERLRGNMIRGNRTESLWEENLPPRGPPKTSARYTANEDLVTGWRISQSFFEGPHGDPLGGRLSSRRHLLVLPLLVLPLNLSPISLQSKMVRTCSASLNKILSTGLLSSSCNFCCLFSFMNLLASFSDFSPDFVGSVGVRLPCLLVSLSCLFYDAFKNAVISKMFVPPPSDEALFLGPWYGTDSLCWQWGARCHLCDRWEHISSTASAKTLRDAQHPIFI